MEEFLEHATYNQSPVKLRDLFYFTKGRKCEVVKLHNNGFEYQFCNPSCINENINMYFISYRYWQRNVVKNPIGFPKLKEQL
jgi:hypothetical protein